MVNLLVRKRFCVKCYIIGIIHQMHFLPNFYSSMTWIKISSFCIASTYCWCISCFRMGWHTVVRWSALRHKRSSLWVVQSLSSPFVHGIKVPKGQSCILFDVIVTNSPILTSIMDIDMLGPQHGGSQEVPNINLHVCKRQQPNMK